MNNEALQIMSNVDTFVNYYNVLECDRSATIEDLKKCFQRLALSFHPDKQLDADVCSEKFLLVQKAWDTLRDPESRKRYDAELNCHENEHLLVYATLNLSDMLYSEEEDVYTYSCRCGSNYILDLDSVSINNSQVFISCDDCSLVVVINNVECKNT